MATYIKGKNARKPHTIRYFHEGKQREKSFATYREAMDFKAKFEHDKRANIFVDPRVAGEKFASVAQRWLERHPGRPKTKRVYGTVLRLHILPAFGDKALGVVAQDREGVERFLRSTLPERGLGASVIRTCYLVIGAVVNDAIKAGRLNQSRLRGIPMPSVMRKAEIPFATQAQVVGLATALPAPYGYTVYLMRGCGLRIGEALGVQESDFRGATLRLSRQVLATGEVGPLKHRDQSGYRDIPVPGYVYAAKPDGWDHFPEIARRTYQDRFSAARRLMELPDGFTPHTLRHMFASAALAGGVPITDVSKWLGHQSIQVTYGIYGHLVPASWDRARAVLDEEWEK